MTKLALGNTQSRVSINGSTVVTEPSQSPVTSPGGLLALPTNIGNYQRDSLTFIPELGATVGYDLTCRLKLTVGYTFLYWSQLMRPGDQIDTNVDQSKINVNTSQGWGRNAQRRRLRRSSGSSPATFGRRA